MKKLTCLSIIGVIFLLIAPFVYANAFDGHFDDTHPLLKVKSTWTETGYDLLKIRYAFGQTEEAIVQAQTYLIDHPNDGDVRLLLGEWYFREQNDIAARQELLIVLKQTPGYTDASLVLINVDLSLANMQEALDTANDGLLFNPFSSELLKKKADIFTMLRLQHAPMLSGERPSVSGLVFSAVAIAKSNATENISEYKNIEALYDTGQHEAAMNRALLYLKEKPNDGDVRLILGRYYFNSKNYISARRELLTVLQQTPNYVDARMILINVEIMSHHYQNALAIAKAGLLLNPYESRLIKKRNDILTLLNVKKNKQTKSSGVPRPKAEEEKKYLNEIGTYQQNYYVSDVKKVWDYSSLFYGRTTPLGKVFGRVNYANRLGFRAVQGEIEAYPKLNKYVYLDLDYSFANEPNLFPNKAYGAEAYVTTGKLFDFSLGGRYAIVDNAHQFYVASGTLSKDLDKGHARVIFRPYFFIPGVGRNSTLYTLNVRHIITDPDYFYGCIIGAGTSPDLADLTTVNFIVMKNKIINPYIGFPLYHNRLLFNLSGLYQNQIFPNKKVRNWSGGTANIVWKF